MPVITKIWEIQDNQITKPVSLKGMDKEASLEEILFNNPSLINEDYLLIGRQVNAFGNFIDLLAIESSGDLVVIELKRDKTPRDIVAQLLDYGSWVVGLQDEDLSQLYSAFQDKYFHNEKKVTLNDALRKKFGSVPDELNSNHSLMIVASSLDSASERIVNYLSSYHGLNVNALFFNYFKNENQEYLSRTWLIDPSSPEERKVTEKSKQAWNGEHYVSFGVGDSRSWEEAVKYGFISAGGGDWYTNTLSMLEPGDRVWVNIPGTGYVGVGMVTGTAQSPEDFKPIGNKSILDLSNNTQKIKERGEVFVPIQWLDTIDVSDAIKEKGFFGNQNTVARPKTPKWDFTINTLKQFFNFKDKKVA